MSVDSPSEVAEIAAAHWGSGNQTAVLVCIPVPPEHALPRAEIETAVGQAIRLAEERGIRGKALTPFLLAEIKESSGGRTLAANRALLVNNATIAAQVAIAIHPPASR